MDDIIDTIAKMQAKYTELWHSEEEELSPQLDVCDDLVQTLYSYVKANHLMNYKLWHTEDIARRKDVPPQVIADCKYKIDGLNQLRTNFYENIDSALIKILAPKLPDVCDNIQNTETLGMTIDRLSILSLKIYHMNEQKLRTDTSLDKVKLASDKLDILLGQKKSLIIAIKYLIQEYLAGKKRPASYYQFKMYNDPDTNPQLYQNKGENHDKHK